MEIKLLFSLTYGLFVHSDITNVYWRNNPQTFKIINSEILIQINKTAKSGIYLPHPIIAKLPNLQLIYYERQNTTCTKLNTQCLH